MTRTVHDGTTCQLQRCRRGSLPLSLPKGAGVTRCHAACVPVRALTPRGPSQRASPRASRLPFPHRPVSLDVQVHPTSTPCRDLSLQGLGAQTPPHSPRPRGLGGELELSSFPLGGAAGQGRWGPWQDVTPPLHAGPGFSSPFRCNKAGRPPGPTSKLWKAFLRTL